MRIPNFLQFNNCLIFNFKNYSSLSLYIFFIFLVNSSSIDAQTVENFTSNGTFTVPTGVTSVKVECWGAGGKGSNVTSSVTGTGGGGGGGAYSSSIVCVLPGENYTINVGAGGGTGATEHGGDTYFGNASLVMAKGGSGLTNNITTGAAGGLASASVGTTKYNGGNGGDRSTYFVIILGTHYRTGAGGGGAGSTGAGNNAVDETAGAAKSNNGGSGANGTDAGLLSLLGGFSGDTGGNYGGGGSGAAKGLLLSAPTLYGGNGASGYVKVTYTTYACDASLTTTWNGSTWSNGTPSACKKAIIGGANGTNYNTAINGSITACSCQINSGNTLTIATTNQLEVYNEITNNGTVIVESNASFLQHYSTIANTGSIHVLRNANPMKRYDFTYWSSPVAGQTLFNLSPTTLADKYYSYTPVTGWVTEYNGAATMGIGRGYAVRAPQTFPINSTANFTGTFQGAPHNGDQTVALFQGSSTTAVWNLIGNPYPSAIDIDLFLADPDNTEVGGTVYLWTHNTPPIANGSGQYTYTSHDYASYNLTGGAATAATNDPNDPTEVDDNDNTPVNGQIASGQAFFIRGVTDGAGTVKFKNAMRITGNNANFFKPGTTTPVENWQMTGKHRFWVNITNAEGAFNQALIGYIENATNELDRLYDGELFGGNYVTIYSLLDQNKLAIQGRGLPFNNQDVVPMGYKVTIAGTFNISLDHFDGLFEGQDVFLKDNLLNVVHNLKDGAYSFTSAIGTFDSRFEMVYVNELLGAENPAINPESIIIYKNTNSDIVVNAGLFIIDEIRVFDITGRLLHESKKVNATESEIQNLPNTQQVLIVDVKTEEGHKISKKIIF